MNNISILLGTGTGAFQTPISYGIAFQPRRIRTGDFNGDGQQDTTVSCGAGNAVAVYLGTGSGTFQNAVIYSAGTGCNGLVVNGFNEDGKQDLVLTNYISSGSINVLLTKCP